MKKENEVIWDRFFIEPLNFLNKEIIFYFKEVEIYEIAKIVAIKCKDRILYIQRIDNDLENASPEAINDIYYLIYYLRGDLIFEVNEDEEL